MSTVQSSSPKHTRKSAKTSAPPSMRSAVSENESSDYPTNNQSPARDGKGRNRGKSTARKQATNYDSAAHSDGPSVRQAQHFSKHHATPIKNQAYAGPTFHQSPAASTLPMPSFYSKSLPSAGMMQPVPEQERPATQSQATQEVSNHLAEVKRETTPLDFLFDAARKAQATPGLESPQYRHLLPAVGKSPSQSPAPREGDTVFPFEMDSNDAQSTGGNTTSITPFKDRLAAVQPGDTSSGAGRNLDEDERRAKTTALKNFLMSSANATELGDNPFNARPAPVQQPNRHFQRHSNPGTPMSTAYDNNQQYFPQYGHNNSGSPSQRPPPSNLRNIYAPEMGFNPAQVSARNGTQQPPGSNAREQTPVKQPFQGYYTPPKSQSPQPRSTPSAQQLEDDLRRVLKLDLTSRG